MSKANIETQQRRLKLRSEQLNTRVRIIEHRNKLRDLNMQIKTLRGGR